MSRAADRATDIGSGIDIVIEDRRWTRALPRVESLCRRFALAALAGQAGPAGIRIALAGDAAIRELNHQFRGIDRPTNVLSFPAHDDETDPAADPGGLGDVMIAYETTTREARAEGIALAAHLAHLVVHGVLHLRGHDHLRAAEAEAMEMLESELLTRLGITDPYAGQYAVKMAEGRP